jgi:hypothetical protein
MATYIERTTAAIEALESAMRSLFKAEDTPPIPYVYNGATYDIRDRETRMLVVAAIQDVYYRDHGEFNQYALDAWYAKGCPGQRPTPVSASTALMDRLTNVVLYDELADEDAHKAQHNEYPIYSDTQLERRREGRRGSESTNMRGETPIRDDDPQGAGVVLAADGRNSRTGAGRRKRSPGENNAVDAGAKIRNKARAVRYKRDTAAGAVVTYNLREGGNGREPGELTEPFTQKCGIGARWLADMSAVNEVTAEPAEVAAELPSAA